MDTEPPRLVMALSASAGAAFWGLYSIAAALRTGRRIGARHLVRLVANVVLAIVAGVLAAWFLGPALVDLIPIASLREPHAFGFILGAAAWEVAPFAFRALRGRAARIVKEGDQ